MKFRLGQEGKVVLDAKEQEFFVKMKRINLTG